MITKSTKASDLETVDGHAVTSILAYSADLGFEITSEAFTGSYTYKADGTPAYTPSMPHLRLKRRPLRTDRPLVANTIERPRTCSPTVNKPYQLVGIYTPMDGSGELWDVVCTDSPDPLRIDPRTGRVPGNRPGRGSNLQFSNADLIRKIGHVINLEDHVISINITETNGDITAVEWVQ